MKQHTYTFLRSCLPFCLLPVSIFAGIGDLDENGWTILTPSEDSRLIYVSSSEGDDSNDGLTPETPKRTIPGADLFLIRDGFPDWILLKRGDTFTYASGIDGLGRWKNGRSAAEPMVMTYYGDEGPRPVIKIMYNNEFIAWDAEPRSHTAYVGIDFYRAVSDPSSPDFANIDGGDALWFNSGPNGAAHNLLVEDCRFLYCGLTIRGQQNSPPYVNNVHVRRNIIMYNWSHNSETQDSIIQGLHCVGVMRFYMEENLIHHNGWSSLVPGALPNQFNHNVYLQRNLGEEIIVTGNIISYGAAHGIQLRSGGVARMNAFVGNAIGMNIGYSNAPEIYQGPTLVSDNVATDGRPQIPNDSSDPQTGAIWGFWRQSINHATTINDNIAANILDNRGGNMSPFSGMSPNQHGTGNIAWSWVRDSEPGVNPGWLDSTRNGDSFAASMGYTDWHAFIGVAGNRPLRTMPFDLTAYAYVDYIREGFNKDPVDPPYNYEGAVQIERWAGFIVNENGDVQTGGFLGLINVSEGDWIWVYSMDKYIWLPESMYSAEGTWAYRKAE